MTFGGTFFGASMAEVPGTTTTKKSGLFPAGRFKEV